ncbi:MAG: alpha/beta hydrolase [Lapillicoccus sp.]
MPEDAEDLSGLGAGPTLVICGREDQITPLEGSELMAAEISGRAPGCAGALRHMSALERPDEVTALLREWLA